MKSRLIGAAVIAALTFVVVNHLNPTSQKDLAQMLAAPSAQADLPPKSRALLDKVAPEAAPEELVDCTDMGKPGVIIGRFCRHFDSYSVNLRFSDTIPVRALRQLPNLTEIDAQNARWANLDPLVEFPGLTSLNLQDAKVKDVSNLASFPQLETLNLANTGITDLASIAELSQLKALSLTGLQIADLTPLQGMTSLQELYLRGTPVTDLSPLASMINLRVLDLRDTAASDITPVAAIEGISIRQ
ncbi:leucine-rich repeat domain-containing protein [Tateyamaria sp. syn59]|uniref:leucine-rich repeat domain-containing protein n=1 Tax=Tateyamaria sp. syn59 TaxID=2576942 RepID=UPI0011BFE608|nr:leucine-rich repeat domain-containing protein [Tateyamaria sp. syn59]